MTASLNQFSKTAIAAFFFFSLICFINGCEKATNSWKELDNSAGTFTGSIVGRIIIDKGDTKVLNITADQTISSEAAGSEIWLERFPEIKTIADKDGNFSLVNVPSGQHYLIARFTDLNNRIFKRKAGPINVDSANSEAGSITLVEASKRISGTIVDVDGNPVVMAVLSLWGEFFTTGNDGRFLSPPLPPENDLAELFINTSGYNELSFSGIFSNSPYPDITITLARAGSSITPPVIQILAASYEVNKSQQVTLTAKLNDSKDTDQLHISWQATAGLLEPRNSGLWSLWTSPSFDTLATVSATITDKNGFSATARRTMTVGSGLHDNKPSEGTATPSIPVNLKVTSSGLSVSLSWNPSSNASHYRIYWANSLQLLNNSPQIEQTATSTFMHRQLIHGLTYFYRITALNQNAESQPGETVQANVDGQAPVIESLFPAHQSVGIATQTSFFVTFNEPITAGSGHIKIYLENGVLQESLEISSEKAAVSENNLSFTLNTPLPDDELLYILISSGAVKDLNGNEFSGINNSSEWVFKTYISFNEDLLWNHRIVNASAAWQYSTGKGIIIAVIDTGIDSQHPDLEQQLALPGRDFHNDGVFLEDGLGHGTHVAGIIGAQPGNGGNIGIAPRSRLYISKVFSKTGTGPSADMMVSAIEDAVANGARIINMSIGTQTFNSVYETAAAWARSQGAILFAAGGNDSGNQLRYLAACPSVFSAGATTQNDEHWSPSNFSDDLDFSAPGEMIYSTLPNSSYGYISGTSMAAPHLSAVAALVWSLSPQFTGNQVYEALQYGSVDLGAPGKDSLFGHGRIDALKALQYRPGSSSGQSLRASIKQVSLPSPDFSIDNYIRGQLLLKLESGHTLSSILRKAEIIEQGIAVLKTFSGTGMMLISAPTGLEKEIAQKLHKTSGVVFCELNAIISFSVD